MADYTFVTETEEVIKEVAEWGTQKVQEIVEALAPDGRPFGAEKKSTEEQLDEYRAMRNDVNQWMAWISQKSQQVSNRLMAAGLGPDQMAVVNPTRIASQFAIAYSIKMEKMLEERMVE